MVWTIYYGVIIFLLGLVMGSFYNVCIYRIPEGLSIISPPSRCGNCGHRLSSMDLIPILSWLMLGRKCRYCKAKISIRYPLVELLTGVLFVLLYTKFDISFNLLIYLILISLLIIVTFIDIDHRIIPDRFIVMGSILGVIYLISNFISLIFSGLLSNISVNKILTVFLAVIPWKEAIIGSLIGGLSLLLVDFGGRILFKKEGMGFGDVKLMFMIGFIIGNRLIVVALLLSVWIAAVFGIILIRIRKNKDDHYMPFGPFLAIGTVVSILIGENIINWYMNFLVKSL